MFTKRRSTFWEPDPASQSIHESIRVCGASGRRLHHYSITAWGDSIDGGSGAPTDTGYTAIFSAAYAFAALKADGSIAAWGAPSYR